MSDFARQGHASAISDVEKRQREYRRREHAIPPEILEASLEDPLVRALTEQYLREGNYVLYLERLVVALYKTKAEVQKLFTVQHKNLRITWTMLLDFLLMTVGQTTKRWLLYSLQGSFNWLTTPSTLKEVRSEHQRVSSKA